MGATTGWPTIATGPFYIGVDLGNPSEETMKVTAYTANTATVVRGADTTTGVTHQVGAGVYIVDTAQDADEANQLVHALLTGGTTGQVATVDTSLTPPIKLAAAPVASFNGGTGAIAQTNGYGIAGANANPPVPAVALTTVQSFITSPVTLTAATGTALTSVSLAAGTWMVGGTGNAQNLAGSISGTDVWVGPNSASVTGAVTTASTRLAVNGGGGDQINLTTQVVPVSPGTTTTFFLNAEGQQSTRISTGGFFAAQGTGITAVRIA